LSKQPLASPDIGAAVERGRANHSQYVLTGAIDKEGAAQTLSIKIARVGDGRLLWSKSYPVAAADPVTIAADVDANAPPLDE
jgi:TolB-like protein